MKLRTRIEKLELDDEPEFDLDGWSQSFQIALHKIYGDGKEPTSFIPAEEILRICENTFEEVYGNPIKFF